MKLTTFAHLATNTNRGCLFQLLTFKILSLFKTCMALVYVCLSLWCLMPLEMSLVLIVESVALISPWSRTYMLPLLLSSANCAFAFWYLTTKSLALNISNHSLSLANWLIEIRVYFNFGNTRTSLSFKLWDSLLQLVCVMSKWVPSLTIILYVPLWGEIL